MKTKCLFLTVITFLFLFTGCNKDAFFDEETELTLKSANVPIPLKGEICMVSNDDRLDVHYGNPDGPVIAAIDLSRTAWLTGNMNHTGKLNEQSFMIGREGAYLDATAYSQGKIIIVATYDAWIVTANRDYLDIVSEIEIDATDPSHRIITGEYTIAGGSGKWENTAGSGILSGIIPCWNVEGTWNMSINQSSNS
jgi:hypothetical protein